MLFDIYLPPVEYRQAEHRIQCQARPPAVNLLELARERRQDREELKQERRAEKDRMVQERRAVHKAGQIAATIESAGGIGKLVMPKGFVEEPADPESFRQIRRFHLQDTQRARIGYEQSPYRPYEEVDRRLTELLKQPPHRLSAVEIDEVASAIPNALYGYNGDFTLVSMETADIAGKRVLILQTSFNSSDRRTFGIFANPDRDKETIDSVWFEAPGREYETHVADALKAFRSISWKDTCSSPTVNHVPFRFCPPITGLK